MHEARRKSSGHAAGVSASHPRHQTYRVHWPLVTLGFSRFSISHSNLSSSIPSSARMRASAPSARWPLRSRSLPAALRLHAAKARCIAANRETPSSEPDWIGMARHALSQSVESLIFFQTFTKRSLRHASTQHRMAPAFQPSWPAISRTSHQCRNKGETGVLVGRSIEFEQ